MRGDAERQTNMLLAVTPDSFIPDDHPIRRIKPIVDAALRRLSPLFDTMYSTEGRPSIPPEHLLKASLLIALYSIRSERQCCERLRYDLLFKWFLDLNISDEPFTATTFSKNRERLLAASVARAFFAEVVAEARRRRLLSAASGCRSSATRNSPRRCSTASGTTPTSSPRAALPTGRVTEHRPDQRRTPHQRTSAAIVAPEWINIRALTWIAIRALLTAYTPR